jgi:type IV fimbrial biogenesis protein FimT
MEKIMNLEGFGKRGSAGFTLIQLLTVMGIIAIIGSISIPSYLSWRPKYLLREAARDLVSSYQLAKMEAVRGNTDVVVLFSQPLPPVTRGGGRGSYIVFVDDGSGAGGVAGDDLKQPGEKLLASEKMPQYVSIRNMSAPMVNSGFNARGLPLKNRIGNVRFTLNFQEDYQVILSMAGNVRIAKP